MREVCFLIDPDGAILWADATGSAAAMPDSRARWEAIWERRDRLEEIAHSHPLGPLAFSHEDRTTMEALDLALGRALRYSVVAPEGMIARGASGETTRIDREPWWTAMMRSLSGMKEE